MNGIELLKKRTFSALKWNTFEAFLYQGILIGHQLFLYWLAPKGLFGAQGALFASAFLLISVLNFSLDSGMTSCFLEITKNKKTFKTFFKSYFIPQVVFLFLGATSFALLACNIPLPARFTLFKDPVWSAIMVLFIVSEGTKKNLRAFLHLAFQNKATASIEVFNIVSYVTSIWLLYFCGISFSLFVLTVPFLFISGITTIILLKKLYDSYLSLPVSDKRFPHDFRSSFFKTRSFLYLNELSRSLFSSNFLLPFFACFHGILQTSTAAFMNALTHAVTFFIQKIFGPSGAALFANGKHLSCTNKQEMFIFLQQKTWYALGFLLILCLLIFQPFITLQSGSETVFNWALLYTFFLSHFLENIFVVYEKFFIAEQKAHYITLCNGISFLGCIVLATLLYNAPLITLLMSFIFLRFAAFISLVYCAHRLWNFSYLTIKYNKN